MNLFTDEELAAVTTGSLFIFDVESYSNFFFIAFKCVKSGKVVCFEYSPDCSLDINKLTWVLFRFCLVGFNSNSYDIPIISLALKGKTPKELNDITIDIIGNEIRPYNVEKKYKVSFPKLNHIDLIEVAPLTASLKTYAGRLHCNRMQDLPYEPTHVLTRDEAEVVRHYCINDLDNTKLLLFNLKDQLALRDEMSREYQVDLRSKSDAQIAEAVISKEVSKLKGYYPKKPIIKEGTTYKYHAPDYINFVNNNLVDLFERILSSTFTIDKNGSPKIPKEIENFKVKINKSTYTIGIGGLHSNEKSIAHIANKETVLIDRDVESYYPRIIINCNLFPKHLGEDFLTVYETLVNKRVEAKRRGKEIKKEIEKLRNKLKEFT